MVKDRPGRATNRHQIDEHSDAASSSACAAAAESPAATIKKRAAYSVELLKTPLGLGLTLGPNDAVTEISPDSQAARDGRIHVGDRVVSINGEMPTTAKPSSIILQGIAAGSTLKLELARKPRRKHKCSEAGAREAGAASSTTEMGQISRVSAAAGSSDARPLPLAHGAHKMRRASELLDAWKIDPAELELGHIIGSGGQADVYAGRWQVSSASQSGPIYGGVRPYSPRAPYPLRDCLLRSRNSGLATTADSARRPCVRSHRRYGARCARSHACATPMWFGCTGPAWSRRHAS